MSYPAQNTDTEFQALIDEIKVLREEVENLGYEGTHYSSRDRLLEVFSKRRLKELFDE